MNQLTRPGVNINDSEPAYYHRRGCFWGGGVIETDRSIIQHENGNWYKYVGSKTLPYAVVAGTELSSDWESVGNGSYLEALGSTNIDAIQGKLNFSSGGSVYSPKDFVYDNSRGIWYYWSGDFPKDFAANSNPYNDPEWVEVGLKQAAFAGYNLRQLSKERISALSGTAIRFVTWNIQGNNSASNYYGGDFGSQKRNTDLNEQFLRFQADFVGCQEVYTTPDNPESLFAQYPYIDAFKSFSLAQTVGRFYGNLAVSTRTFKAKSSVKFASQPIGGSTDTELRSYTRTVITVGTTDIAVYVTHLSLDSSRIAEEITELAAAIQADTVTRVVAMGDWNTNTDSDFNPLTSIGLTMINKNGEINTNNVGGTWYIDRIFHKGFSNQVGYGTFDNVPVSLADHKPLYVDLIV